MAEKRFDANYTFKFNSIPFQNLFSPNQLRIDNWNKIINQLSAQGNNLSWYLQKLDTFLFGTKFETVYPQETEEGFLQYLALKVHTNESDLKGSLNKINTINSTLTNHTKLLDDFLLRIIELEKTDNSHLLDLINAKVDSTYVDQRVSESVNTLEISLIKASTEYTNEKLSEAKKYTDNQIVDINISIDSLNSNTVAGIKVIDNPTAEEITNKVKPYLGTSAQVDTGTGVGQIPTIQNDGKLPKSIIPISDALIRGGYITRVNDTEALITPSEKFLEKYPEVGDEEVYINTETTAYKDVYFVVRNVTDATVLGIPKCNSKDWIVADGTLGFSKIDNNENVESVNGKTGEVIINAKDTILENYATSELDDNNIYPTDSAQTGISKLDKRVKTLEAKSSEALPNVVLEIANLDALTASEQAIIINKIKAITNNLTTDLDTTKFNEVVLRNDVGTESNPDLRQYSLVSYEHKKSDPTYYKFTFNLDDNTEYELFISQDLTVSVQKLEFAKKEDVDSIQTILDEIEDLVDELNGDSEVLLNDILGEDI